MGTLRVGTSEILNRIEHCPGLVYVRTKEETRVIKAIKNRFKRDIVSFWTPIRGLHEIKDPIYYNTFELYLHLEKTARKLDNVTSFTLMDCMQIIRDDCMKVLLPPSELPRRIYILLGAMEYIEVYNRVRFMKELTSLLSTTESTIVIVEDSKVSNEILNSVNYCDMTLNLLTAEEIKSAYIEKIKKRISEFNKFIKEGESKIAELSDENAVAEAFVGMTEDQICDTVEYLTSSKKELTVSDILQEKSRYQG